MGNNRELGIADAPRQGAEFGSLNTVTEPNVQKRLDRHVNNVLSAARDLVLESHVPNTLADRGTYRAVVMKILPPPSSYEEYPRWVRKIYEPLGIKPPTLVMVKARLTEKDIGLPDAAEYGDTKGPHEWIIDMHDTYVAISDTITVPAVGSVIEVDFEDKQNFEGGKIVAVVAEQQQSIGASSAAADGALAGAMSAAEAYNAARGACGGGHLGAMGPSGGPLGTGAGSYPIGDLPPGSTGDGPWYTRPDGAEGVTTIVVHSTAGGHYDDAEDALGSWINHGQRSPEWDEEEQKWKTKKVSTHFVITGDGTIVNLLPPFGAGAWHAGHMNRIAVGIDMCGDPDPSTHPHTPEQFAALAQLVETRELWNLAIIGHRHHSSNRSDPGHIVDMEERHRGTSSTLDEFPFDQEPFASRTLPGIAAVGLRESGPAVGASGIGGEPPNRTWLHIDDDTFERAEDAEGDLRGKVGPEKRLGSGPLTEIYNRLRSDSSRAAQSRISYAELGTFVDKVNEYVTALTGRAPDADMQPPPSTPPEEQPETPEEEPSDSLWPDDDTAPVDSAGEGGAPATSS